MIIPKILIEIQTFSHSFKLGGGLNIVSCLIVKMRKRRPLKLQDTTLSQEETDTTNHHNGDPHPSRLIIKNMHFLHGYRDSIAFYTNTAACMLDSSRFFLYILCLQNNVKS